MACFGYVEKGLIQNFLSYGKEVALWELYNQDFSCCPAKMEMIWEYWCMMPWKERREN